VLYVCFCENPNWEENNKVDIHVPFGVTDEIYLEMVRDALFARLKAFQPEVLFWNWGYDGTQGEYGDIGLTADFHVLLAKELRGVADEICRGRFIIVLCGGSRRDLACYLIPRVIAVLAEK
jgi:acetoin utilization deacetylase AcuC-like enzyme